MAPADWLPFLTELADRADALARRWFRAADLRVAEKPDLSPVTEADRAIEAMARRLVREHHPELGVLGEEEGDAPGSAETRLIIDPIDGTRNFVRGIPVFATLIAIETTGEAGPPPGIAGLIARVERTRGFGDFYQHMLVAEGAGEAAIDPVVQPWDIAALQVIVEEAGGRATDLSGERSIRAKSLLTSNGLLQDSILAILKPS